MSVYSLFNFRALIKMLRRHLFAMSTIATSSTAPLQNETQFSATKLSPTSSGRYVELRNVWIEKYAIIFFTMWLTWMILEKSFILIDQNLWEPCE